MKTHSQSYNGNGKPEYAKSPERLQHEVDETRHRIEDRLDSLSHSLSPGELLDQALGMARRHGGEFGGNLGRQVKQNPLPLLLTGIGLSWLMMSRNDHYPASGESLSPGIRERAGGAMHRAGDKARHAKERAGEMTGAVQERAHSMQERAHSAVSSLEHRARSGQQQLNEFFHDQPILAGSLAIAIGAALGSMLPRSETEDRVMGEISDEAKVKAKEKGSEQYEKARERGSEAVQAADRSGNQSSPGDSPRMSPSSSSSSGSPRI